MPTKTDNLKLNIYSEEERVLDWMNGSDENFQILDNTAGKVLYEIERNSRNLANIIQLDDPYGTRIEEFDTLNNAPFNGGTSGVNVGKYIYFFNYEGPLVKYNIETKSQTNLDIYYATEREEEPIQYEHLQSFMYSGTKIAINNIVYIFPDESKTVYEYDINDNCFYPSSIDFSSWNFMGFNRALITLVEYSVYIFGISSGNSNYSFKINLVTKEVSTITKNGTYMYSLGIPDNTNENIYLIGGIDASGSDNLKQLMKYSIANDTYTWILNLDNKPSYALGGSKIKNTVFLFGGIERVSYANRQPRKIIQIFDMINEEISTMTLTLPEKLTYLNAFTRKGEIYLIGGKINTTERDQANKNAIIYKFIEY